MGIYQYKPEAQASASFQARVNPGSHSLALRAGTGKFPSSARLTARERVDCASTCSNESWCGLSLRPVARKKLLQPTIKGVQPHVWDRQGLDLDVFSRRFWNDEILSDGAIGYSQLLFDWIENLFGSRILCRTTLTNFGFSKPATTTLGAPISTPVSTSLACVCIFRFCISWFCIIRPRSSPSLHKTSE